MNTPTARTFALVVAAVFVVTHPMLGQTYAHPMYIAIRSDGQIGTGTATDPFDGSTPTKFANAVNSFGPNTHVILGPGVFAVNPFELKAGDIIEGASTGTTLQLAPQTAPWGIGGSNTGSVIWGISAARTNGVHIRNILFDCNLQNQPGGSEAGAVTIYGGNHSSIENCRAINWGTTQLSTECFVFFIESYNDGGPAVGNKILNCYVDTPAPVVHGHGGTTGIGIGGGPGSDQVTPGNGWQFEAEISGCVVHDITTGSAVGQPWNFNAIGVPTFTYGSTVRGNHVYNLAVGSGAGGIACALYGDTGSLETALIANNVFNSVAQGIYFPIPAVSWQVSDVKICNNLIRASGGIILGYSGTNASRVQITDNTLLGSGIGLTYISNVTVQGNTIDASVPVNPFPVSSVTNLAQSGNHKSDGTIAGTPTPLTVAEGGRGAGLPVTYATRPASPAEGMIVGFTDAKVNSWGSNITAGGGTNHVLAYYDGKNWTVMAK